MDVKAEHRYAKISAFKVREVTREIQGLPAEQALEIVRLIPKKSARLIGKVLASAIANAENNNNLRAINLVVKQAVAGVHALERGAFTGDSLLDDEVDGAEVVVVFRIGDGRGQNLADEAGGFL